jgi:predicted site-specific integrase-resolvase
MKLIPLSEWREARYGDAINQDTARRWARTGKIQPTPKKEGREFFVQPNAEYIDPSSPPKRLVNRIRGRQSENRT